MKRPVIVGSHLVLILMIAALARAQSSLPELNRCTTANLMGGVASTSGHETPLFGGAVGWELIPRLTIETTTKWLLPDRGAEAFAVTFTAQVPLLSRRTVVPFVTGGMGAYSAKFGPESTEVPEVYRGRTTEAGVNAGAIGWLTDPAYVFGGGVSIFLAKHVSIRPEVESLWVRRDSSNHFVTTASVRLAYHFELHRVTPTTWPR